MYSRQFVVSVVAKKIFLKHTCGFRDNRHDYLSRKDNNNISPMKTSVVKATHDI